MVEEKKADLFVRLRGLPFSAGEDQVREFFTGIGITDVLFINTPDGRPAGECYCEFENEADVNLAMKKNQETMGSRYIEIFPVGDVELEKIIRKRKSKKMGENVGALRMRGLPFSCKKDDITTFFKDFVVEEVIFGKEPGEWGRPTGEAYVRFGSKQEAEKALQLNGQHIGHRYLELFRVDGDAFDLFKNRMNKGAIPLNSLPNDPWSAGYQYQGGYGYDSYGGGYSGGGGGPAPGYPRGGPSSYRYSPYDYHGRGGGGHGHGGYDAYRGGGGPEEFITPTKIQMRGVPFRITGREIEEFFAPLQCIEVKLGYYEDGRSTGDAIVEFSTMAEAREAMKKDHESIGSRYIEIFPANVMKIPQGAFYKTVGGRMPGAGQPPAPLSASGYQWPSY